MKFEISNRYPDLEHQVRLTIDTSREEALKIMELIAEYERGKPDPILEALKRAGAM